MKKEIFLAYHQKKLLPLKYDQRMKLAYNMVTLWNRPCSVLALSLFH